MKTIEQPIDFAGTTLGRRQHICALFYSEEQEYRVLLPFIKEGFERGEKAFHIVDPKLRDQHLGRLQAAGIDTLAEEHYGRYVAHINAKSEMAKQMTDNLAKMTLVQGGIFAEAVAATVEV